MVPIHIIKKKEPVVITHFIHRLPAAVVAFHHLARCGSADNTHNTKDGGKMFTFIITDNDRARWPLLRGGETAVIVYKEVPK